MKPEERARVNIDELLGLAGWSVQDRKELDLSAGQGIAVREVDLSDGTPDYFLCVPLGDGKVKAIGFIEAKKEGVLPANVEVQAEKYTHGVPPHIPHVPEPLPFQYISTGVETVFRDLREPNSRSRAVFGFHRPEMLREMFESGSTLRARLHDLPAVPLPGKLWNCQREAISRLEDSLAKGRKLSLIQMATGSGKTFTAVNFVYRLIKNAKAKRVLFLVDRTNLGKQAENEFKKFEVPGDGRKFSEIYPVQRMASNKIDPVSTVCITTIQRLYSMLRGQEIPPEEEEGSLFTKPIDEAPVEITYNKSIPIEMFDVIVVDECHRSIYSKWRPVLEYFDSFVIGLTATPSKQTIGFFKQNLVMEYPHERAVADGINVDYDVYRIKTEITQRGGSVPKGSFIYKRDRLTRRKRWESLDDEVTYEAEQLDRAVVAPDQIRTVIRAFKQALFTDLFPGRKEVPKTLVFAKDDSHAEDIVRIIREEFEAPNEFCQKITYTAANPETIISSMRNDYFPRIAVTVDLVSTGIDIKPLECLLFMRDVKSSLLFEQMKGRGTRVINENDLRQVTSDASGKTRFMIVDAIGVCESEKTDTQPLERKHGVSFDQLLERMAWGNLDEDNLSSLASRLSRLDKELTEKQRKEIEDVAKVPLRQLINNLLDAIEPDLQEAKAREMFDTKEPTEEQMKKASEELAKESWAPFKPALRNKLSEIKKQSEQIIDEVSLDKVTFSGFDSASAEKAKRVLESFTRFIDENKDELTALQIIYSRPHSQRKITYEQIEALAERMTKAPYNLNQEIVWEAYKTLEKSRVQGAGPGKLLTNIVSLLRFSLGQMDVLEPFEEIVNERFGKWLSERKAAGETFTKEQLGWLEMIKQHIAESYSIDSSDFSLVPFNQKGGIIAFQRAFGGQKRADEVLEEVRGVLVE